MVAGALMLAAAWLVGQQRQPFDALLGYVPDGVISTIGAFVPGNDSFLLRELAPAAAVVLAFLLVFGLRGGWLLAGHMLAPPARITDATRMGPRRDRSRTESSYRAGNDEFRELADAFDAMLSRVETAIR